MTHVDIVLTLKIAVSLLAIERKGRRGKYQVYGALVFSPVLRKYREGSHRRDGQKLMAPSLALRHLRVTPSPRSMTKSSTAYEMSIRSARRPRVTWAGACCFSFGFAGDDWQGAVCRVRRSQVPQRKRPGRYSRPADGRPAQDAGELWG